MNIKLDRIKVFGLALAMSGAVFSGSVNAADLDPPIFEQTEQTEVEFGTGWYIRGDIGTSMTDVVDAVNYGTPIPLTLGAGFMWGDSIRTEVAFTQFANLATDSSTSTSCGTSPQVVGGVITQVAITGSCTLDAEMNPTASALMVNAYYDLPKMFGVRPYVGAGIGGAMISRGDVRTSVECSGTVSADCNGAGVTGGQLSSATDDDDGDFTTAMSFMIGGAYSLSNNIWLDAGYRYTRIGEANLAGPTSSGFDVNEIKLGLRVELW